MGSEALGEKREIWQETLGWQPDSTQQAQFQQLYQEILQINRSLNLTRITGAEAFLEKHLWDSLAPVLGVEFLKMEENKRLISAIDIGTGAGFPGIPLAIAFPLWQVTLLDSREKKINFLKGLLQRLNLENANTLVGRAEKIAQDKRYRESYDLATIRAVAAAPVCAEYALPFLKVGGLALLYRGHWHQEESLALASKAEKLGGHIELVKETTTPLSQSQRHWIYLRKLSPTPLPCPKSR